MSGNRLAMKTLVQLDRPNVLEDCREFSGAIPVPCARFDGKLDVEIFCKRSHQLDWNTEAGLTHQGNYKVRIVPLESATMSNFEIHAEGLGKRYLLGRQTHSTIRESLHAAASTLLKGRRAVPQGDGELWALRDVSFHVEQGEVLGVIGRNGAGKSTLLKILARITEPTTGTATIFGRVGVLLEVGTGFHPELTGRENIYLNGMILGMRRTEVDRKFEEIVAFSEIERFLDTPVKRYSSGMQMRLAFSVAAHLEPDVLLVDEVLAVGDAAFQRKCLGRMRDISSQGRTVVFVSHNLQAVRSLCDRALVLESGRLTMTGPVEDCVERYLATIGEEVSSDVMSLSTTRPSVVANEARLRITRVRLESERKGRVVLVDDPISVSLEFEVTAAVEDVVFGWGVHSVDDVRIFECRSVDSYQPIPRLPPGRYSLRSQLSVGLLNEGLYTLHVGARSAERGLDYLPDILTFRVESKEKYESLWLEAPSGGLIRVRAEWTLPERRI